MTNQQDTFLDVFHMFRRVEGKQNYHIGLCAKDVFLFHLYSPKYATFIQRTLVSTWIYQGYNSGSFL